MKRIALSELGRNVLQLPRLPVPSLMSTFDTYRSYLRPLKSTDAVVQHSSRLDEFLALSAPALQKYLVELDKRAADADAYPFTYVESMLNSAKLAQRQPLVVHANPAVVLKREAVLGAAACSHDSSSSSSSSSVQATVAAALTHALGGWLADVVAHGLPVHTDTVDVSPLLHEFGRARVPGKDRDELFTAPLETLRHVVVLHDAHSYVVQLFDERGALYERAVLQKAFEVILNITPDQDNTTPVSVLTAGNRAVWAQAYQELLRAPENAEALRQFQEAALVICLDSKRWGGAGDGGGGGAAATATASLSATAAAAAAAAAARDGSASNAGGVCAVAAALHGGPEELENRWYDKHQLLIDASGQVALNFEVAVGDRVHWGRWVDDLLHRVQTDDGGRSGSDGDSCAATASLMPRVVRPLSVTYGKSFVTHVRTARLEASALATDTEVQTLHLPFGHERLAALNVDVDAFVQMCLQLAQYSLRDTLCPASQLVSTTGFFHGSTDVVRTATAEMQHVAQRLADLDRRIAGTAHGDGSATTMAAAATTASPPAAAATTATTTAAAAAAPASTAATPAAAVAAEARATAAASDAAGGTATPTDTAAGTRAKSDSSTTGAGGSSSSSSGSGTSSAVSSSGSSVSETLTAATTHTTTSTTTMEELAQWIRAASARHVQLVEAARSGHGIERHLGALYHLARANEDKPALAFFEDDVYKSMSTYLLRTSAFSAPWLQYYGVGPLHKNGFGVGYTVDAHELRLSLCAFSNSTATDLSELQAAIVKAAMTVTHILATART